MNLTERQVELILSLLATYSYVARDFIFIDFKEIHFYGRTYKILAENYDIVCEIIDYIKGVKK